MDFFVAFDLLQLAPDFVHVGTCVASPDQDIQGPEGGFVLCFGAELGTAFGFSFHKLNVFHPVFGVTGFEHEFFQEVNGSGPLHGAGIKQPAFDIAKGSGQQ